MTVFLSYSRQDRDVAGALVRRLRAAEVCYWIDEEQLDVTTPLEPQLGAAIAGSSVVWLLDTAASRASAWVRYEREVARRRGVRLELIPPEALDRPPLTPSAR